MMALFYAAALNFW